MKFFVLSRLLICLLVVPVTVSAGERPIDRASLFNDGAVTSDDLRRVSVPKGYHEPPGAILIRNARLFDGTGAAARNVSIVIEGSHIVQILAAGAAVSAPPGAEVIDAAGRTVMPGLIDLHTHITYVDSAGLPDAVSDTSQAAAALRGQEHMRYYIESGVTSIRDVASHGMAPFLLKQWQSEGRIAGPRIFAAGQLITGVGGHGAESPGSRTAPTYSDAPIYEANGPDGFRRAVREQFKRGADLIKLASTFNEEEVKAAVQEAHNLGLRVTVDSESIFTAMAVEAGVDCVEHPLPRSDETVRLMAKKGIASVITLTPYQYINAGGGYMFSTSRRFSETDAINFAMARKLEAAGVKIGIGTDLVGGWYRYLPDAYLQELRNYQRLGHSASQALVAATHTNSEILGMSDRLGTAEVGKLADLIIVAGQPDKNTDELLKIDIVFVNGRVEVRDGRASVPRHIQEKPLYSRPLSKGP